MLNRLLFGRVIWKKNPCHCTLSNNRIKIVSCVILQNRLTLVWLCFKDSFLTDYLLNHIPRHPNTCWEGIWTPPQICQKNTFSGGIYMSIVHFFLKIPPKKTAHWIINTLMFLLPLFLPTVVLFVPPSFFVRLKKENSLRCARRGECDWSLCPFGVAWLEFRTSGFPEWDADLTVPYICIRMLPKIGEKPQNGWWK